MQLLTQLDGQELYLHHCYHCLHDPAQANLIMAAKLGSKSCILSQHNQAEFSTGVHHKLQELLCQNNIAFTLSCITDRKSIYARYGRRAHVETDAADGRMRMEESFKIVSRTDMVSLYLLTWLQSSSKAASSPANKQMVIDVCWNGFFCYAHDCHRQNRLLSLSLCGLDLMPSTQLQKQAEGASRRAKTLSIQNLSAKSVSSGNKRKRSFILPLGS